MTRLEGLTVVSIQRRKQTLTGSPRFSIVLDTNDEMVADTITLRTRTDSSWASDVEVLNPGDTVDVVVGVGNWVDGIWKVES